MIGPIARIVLRYAAAALVTYGVISEDIGNQIATDPDLLMIVGLGLGAAAEAAYALAKKRGGAT
jgi:GTP cyclohydrolase III